MSAWVCSKAHIDAMVTAGIELGGSYERYGKVAYPENGGWKSIELSPLTADQVGQMLRDTIVTGVSHRYPDDDVSKGELPGPSGGDQVWYLTPYKFEQTRMLADGELVSLVAAYGYQACEHNEWTETFGYRFCEHVKAHVLRHVQDAWEQENGAKAEWGYEDEHVFPGFKRFIVTLGGDLHPSQGPIQTLQARSEDEARDKAVRWYGGRIVAIEQSDREVTTEEYNAAVERLERQRNEPELIAYAVELRGGGAPLVRLEATDGEAACKLAVETFGGEAVEWYPHPAPLTETEILEVKARLAPQPQPEAEALPVPPLNPEIADMLRRLGPSAPDAPADDDDKPSIRNNR